MKVPSASRAFQSAAGEVILYLDRDGQNIAYSPDGKSYFTLYSAGAATSWAGGKLTDQKLHWEDPHHNTRGEWHLQGDVLTRDGREFREVTPPVAVRLVPLPRLRIPVNLFKTSSDEYVYVSWDRFHSAKWNQERIYVGRGPVLREQVVTGGWGLLDGGTKWLRTATGELYVPARNRGGQATWKGNPLQKLDPADFVIRDAGTKTVNIAKALQSPDRGVA